jgi:hypothetical protein
MVEEKPIDVEKWELGRLENEIQKGELRIPRFQREFVWERSKVVKLLQSVYNQYPIGSFFLWEALPKYNKFFKNVAELAVPLPQEYDRITFILDGQQRITSIYVTLKGMQVSGEDYRKICFDLDKEEFVVEEADNQRFVAVADIFSESEHLKVYNNLTDSRKTTFQRCRERFVNYPFSIVKVRNQDLEEAIDVFELINQGGKRLRLFDLVAASTWTETFDIRDQIERFNQKFVKVGFGALEPEIVIETLSLALKGQCTRSYQLMLGTDVSVKEIVDAWQKVLESVEMAIEFLKTNLGVEKYEFLPYRDMVPLIAYLFHNSDKMRINSAQKTKISEWFWRVALSERYSTTTFTRMGEDRELFDKILAGEDVQFNYPISVTVEKIKSTRMNRDSALRNAVLCMLALKQPISFRDNTKVRLDDNYFSDFKSPEKHHIFPKAFLSRQGVSADRLHLLPNFCFIPKELNDEILDDEPKHYFAEYKGQNPEFEKALETHLIPNGSDSGIWQNDYDLFVSQRASKIMNEIEKLVPILKVS